jgi:hypothetical protein
MMIVFKSHGQAQQRTKSTENFHTTEEQTAKNLFFFSRALYRNCNTTV